MIENFKSDSRQKLLLISDRFYPENFLVNSLVRNWDAMGIHVDVLTQIPSYPHDRYYPGFAHCYRQQLSPRVSVRRTKATLGYSRAVLRKILGYLLFAFRASVVAIKEFSTHRRVFVYQTGPLTQALPVALLKLLGKCERAVIWTQDVWPDTVYAYGFRRSGIGARLLEAFVRWMYSHFDCVLVSSPGFAERLRDKVPSSCPIVYVPQWAPEDFDADDQPDFEPRDADTQTAFVFTGNIGSMQNLSYVVDAFFRVPPEDALLHIVGDGSERRRLEERVLSRGQKNVRFVGTRPLTSIKRLIQSCDFSLLSLSDDASVGMTIPAKFIAYLSAQRPIVCVAKGEVRKIVARNQIGIVAYPSDVESITQAIRTAVASDVDMRAEWSTHMQSLAEQQFDRTRSIGTITRTILS